MPGQSSPIIEARLSRSICNAGAAATNALIALSLGLSADGPPVLPTREEVDAAIAQLAGNDEAMVATIELLRQADSAPDDAVCDAERLRLRKILELPVERRTLLLRSLVEN